MNAHIQQSCLSAYFLSVGQLALVYNKTIYDVASGAEYKSNIIKSMMKQGITLTDVIEFLHCTEENSRAFFERIITTTNTALMERESALDWRKNEIFES